MENQSAKLIIKRIDSAIRDHENRVITMSNQELYDLVYDDHYDPNDFESKELEKRGIGKCTCSGSLQNFGCPAKRCCYWNRKAQLHTTLRYVTRAAWAYIDC